MTPDPAPDETERAGDLCAACGHERGEHLPPCEMGISTGRPCGCRQFKVPDETEREALIERITDALVQFDRDQYEGYHSRPWPDDKHRLSRIVRVNDAQHAAWAAQQHFVEGHGGIVGKLAADFYAATAELSLLKRENERLRRDAADQLPRDGQDMRLEPHHCEYVDLAKGYASTAEELRAESAHRRDALHHAWAERDRLRVQVAELKAERVAGVTRIAQVETTLADATEALTKAPLRPTTYHWETYAVDRKALIRRFWAVLANEEPTPADRGPLTPHPPPWPVSIDGVLTSPKPSENFDKGQNPPMETCPTCDGTGRREIAHMCRPPAHVTAKWERAEWTCSCGNGYVWAWSAPDWSKPGSHHDNACERRSGHEWPRCNCSTRAISVPASKKAEK